jgi:hypothetical protein
MNQEVLADGRKELHALENKIMAFPEQDWTRERKRVAELRAMIADEERKQAAA